MSRLTTHPQRLRHRPLRRAASHQPPMTPPPRQPQGTPQRKARRMRPQQMKRLRINRRRATRHQRTQPPHWRADFLGPMAHPDVDFLAWALLGKKKPAFTGLGSAVVKPPPGYDPNNPEATRKAAEAARTAEREKRWQNQSGKPPGDATGDQRKRTDGDNKDRTEGRPRRRASDSRRDVHG